MKGYIVANVAVHDTEAYAEYQRHTPGVVAKYGGRFLVRGGPVTPVEGEAGLDRLVVLEFPSVAAARRFYDSADYQAILPLRLRNATSTLVIAEGFEAEEDAPSPPGSAWAS